MSKDMAFFYFVSKCAAVFGEGPTFRHFFYSRYDKLKQDSDKGGEVLSNCIWTAILSFVSGIISYAFF